MTRRIAHAPVGEMLGEVSFVTAATGKAASILNRHRDPTEQRCISRGRRHLSVKLYIVVLVQDEASSGIRSSIKARHVRLDLIRSTAIIV